MPYTCDPRRRCLYSISCVGDEEKSKLRDEDEQSSLSSGIGVVRAMLGGLRACDAGTVYGRRCRLHPGGARRPRRLRLVLDHPILAACCDHYICK
jgi:hypothetical protein